MTNKSLSTLQQTFSILIAHLIQFAYRNGYTISVGEFYRSPETAALYAKQGKGIKNSLHTQRLAADLNLFKDGIWLTDAEQHEPIGIYWESLSTPGIMCCWGGRFKPKPDGNHYSISYAGRR